MNLNQGLKTMLISYFPALDLISDLSYLSLRIDLSKSSFRMIRTNSVCFKETRNYVKTRSQEEPDVNPLISI